MTQNAQVELDAKRYQRLRILGCAPMDTDSLESGTVMRFQNLDEHIDTDITRNPSRGEYQDPTGP